MYLGVSAEAQRIGPGDGACPLRRHEYVHGGKLYDYQTDRLFAITHRGVSCSRQRVFWPAALQLTRLTPAKNVRNPDHAALLRPAGKL